MIEEHVREEILQRLQRTKKEHGVRMLMAALNTLFLQVLNMQAEE